MRERIVIRGPFPEGDPVLLREAVAAALGSLKVAWEADRMALLGLVVLQAVTAGADVAQLALSGKAVGAVAAGERPRAQARRLVLMGGLSLATVAGQNLGSTLETPLAQAVFRRTEGRILDAVADLELADVEDPGFQDRLQRALSGTYREQMLVREALSFPPAIIGLVGSVATMGVTDRALVPLGLVGVLPRFVLERRMKDPTQAMWMRGREGREAATLRHYLTGTGAAHELRVFGAAPFLRARHDQLSAEAAAAEVDLMRSNTRRQVVGALAGRAADGPAAGRLLLKVTRREETVSDAVTRGLATRRMAGGFQRMVDMLGRLRHTATMVTDARKFAAQTGVTRTGPAPSRDFRRIVVEDLCFTYRGGAKPVLDGVNLEIRQGEVVALVGENGSGKTTLAKILCALYQPTKGTVRWDDLDAGKCDPAGVRSNIAVVFQDFVRYPTLTAAQNIGVGLPSSMGDRAAIVEAARRAGAHEAIAALPRGYDTVLSRQFDGVDLSSGQWQRVALARAFLRDAPLVVLDEPTAALDPRAERDLFETVASLYRSRSAVLISHRLSSVRFADRICVLAGGRITESGTHHELIAAQGDYAELFDLQARAYR